MKCYKWKKDDDGTIEAECPQCKKSTFASDTVAHRRVSYYGAVIKCSHCDAVFELDEMAF